MEEHDDLERQMIRGQLNTHTTLSNLSERINDIEAFLYGINDALIEKGVIPSRFLYKKIERVKYEMMESGGQANAGITLRVDDETFPATQINCLERMPICKAICCKLSFPLNVEEVELGGIKWDLGKPYYIRQSDEGWCCNMGKEGKCKTYDDRPVVCRTYTCEGDERIWKDYDQMIINEKWINENLTAGLPK